MKSQIKRWDKNAAVVIPSKLLIGAKVDVGSVVDVCVVDGKIVIQALGNTEKMFFLLRQSCFADWRQTWRMLMSWAIPTEFN